MNILHNYYRQRQQESNKKALSWSIITATAVGLVGFLSHKENRTKANKILKTTLKTVQSSINENIDFNEIKDNGSHTVQDFGQKANQRINTGINFAKKQVGEILDEFQSKANNFTDRATNAVHDLTDEFVQNIIDPNAPKTVNIKVKSTKTKTSNNQELESELNKKAEEFASQFQAKNEENVEFVEEKTQTPK